VAGPGRTGRAGPWRGYASALVAPLGHARWSWTTSMASAGQQSSRSGPPADPAGHPRASRPPASSAVLYRQVAADRGRAAHQPRTTAAAAGLAAGDPAGAVAAAWQGKELLRARSMRLTAPPLFGGRSRVLPLGRCGWGGRAVTPGPDDQGVAGRTRCLPHHRWLLQRTHRALILFIKKARRVGHGFRHLRQLPTTAATALRRHLANAPNRKTATPLPHLVTSSRTCKGSGLP
jgi:hypothetical protein